MVNPITSEELLIRVCVPLLDDIKNGAPYNENLLRVKMKNKTYFDFPLNNDETRGMTLRIIKLLINEGFIYEPVNETQFYQITPLGLEFTNNNKQKYEKFIETEYLNRDKNRKREEAKICKEAGTKKETETYRLLTNNSYSKHQRVLRNIIIKSSSGKQKSEIDCILLSNGGLFVIECKQLNGQVTGKIDENDWVVIRNSDSRNRTNRNQKNKSAPAIIMKNPILQNKKHIETLIHKTGAKKENIISIIVFSDQTDLRVKRTINKDTFLLKSSQLVPTIKQIIAEKNLSIEDEEIDRLYKILQC